MRRFVSICLVSALVFCSCASTGGFTAVKDSTRSSIKYGKTELYAWILKEKGFNQFKMYGRRLLVEHSDLSEKEKLQIANSMDKLQYEENKYIYFGLLYNMPFLAKELNLKFKILDKNDHNLYAGDVLIPIKSEIISSLGTDTSYNYNFVIYTKKKLDSVMKDSGVRMIVQFPDGSETIYNVVL